MTLLTLNTTARLYSEQVPKWQRFQTVLSTTGTSTGIGNSNVQQQQAPHQYQRQYSHVYYQRLRMLGPMICQRMLQCNNSIISSNDSNNSNSDSNVIHTTRILELPEDVLCSCVGTLIVERALKPQPKENEDDNDDNDTIILDTTTTTCSYYLEDESGRVALNFTSWWNKYSSLQNENNDNDKHDIYTENIDIHSLGGDSRNSNDTPIDLCTGVVIGIVGIVGIDGIMNVQKVYTAATVQTVMLNQVGSNMQNTITSTGNIDTILSSNSNNNNTPYLLLLSGLDCGHPNAVSSSLSREMLLSYLQGVFPHPNSKAGMVVHVIIAGGLIYDATNTATATATTASSSTTGTTATSSTTTANTNTNSIDDTATMMIANGCRDLDIFCYQMTQVIGIPITIIPGLNDPTTANWPQRPIHPSLIPISTNSNNVTASTTTSGNGNNKHVQLLNRCPNPYAAQFNLDNDIVTVHTESNNINTNNINPENQRYVIGTDGTNISDWIEQSKRNRPISTTTNTGNNNNNNSYNNDEIQALHATLAHQHLCPTGPDTVPTAPHIEIDPMVMTTSHSMNESNHTNNNSNNTVSTLYFAGNCKEFQTKLVSVNTLKLSNNDTDNTSEETQNDDHNHDDIQKLYRLVCIPKFSITNTAVLVNLNTLQVELLEFDTTDN